jgi:hypothetical protein
VSPGTEPWNKWGAYSNSKSWVKITLAEPTRVSGIGFKSANDCIWRDPDEVTIQYVD